VTENHWTAYHRRWARLTAPLRPDRDVVDGFVQALTGHSDRVLLLGVTPELADIGAEVTAIDRSPTMIAHVWPGDTARRRALAGDWLELPAPGRRFTAAVGDGSLNALTWPDGQRSLYSGLTRVLEPGGRFAARLFVAPAHSESLDAVAAEARAGRIRSFHAFKWRLAMALVAAAGDPNLRVESILQAFESAFPDRARLAADTGWSREDIDTIDVYRQSGEVYSFPTEAQFRAAIPAGFSAPLFRAAGGYELAGRCPLMILDLPR
jgi:SAM-dependent methyltransferase